MRKFTTFTVTFGKNTAELPLRINDSGELFESEFAGQKFQAEAAREVREEAQRRFSATHTATFDPYYVVRLGTASLDVKAIEISREIFTTTEKERGKLIVKTHRWARKAEVDVQTLTVRTLPNEWVATLWGDDAHLLATPEVQAALLAFQAKLAAADAVIRGLQAKRKGALAEVEAQLESGYRGDRPRPADYKAPQGAECVAILERTSEALAAYFGSFGEDPELPTAE